MTLVQVFSISIGAGIAIRLIAEGVAMLMRELFFPAIRGIWG